MRTIWTFGCSFSSGYLEVPQEMLYYNNEVLTLPKTDNPKNLSLNDYLDEKYLTIGHEYPDKYPFGDTHPGFKGHQEIFKKIKEKLKQWG